MANDLYYSIVGGIKTNMYSQAQAGYIRSQELLVGSHSPEGEGHSPEGEGHSPEGKGHSPEGKGHSPEGGGHSFEGEGHSPVGEGGVLLDMGIQLVGEGS